MKTDHATEVRTFGLTAIGVFEMSQETRVRKLENASGKHGADPFIILRAVVSGGHDKPTKSELGCAYIVGIPGSFEPEQGETEDEFYHRLQAIRHLNAPDASPMDIAAAIEELRSDSKLEDYGQST